MKSAEAFGQYLDLYRANRSLFDGGRPELLRRLNAWGEAALAAAIEHPAKPSDTDVIISEERLFAPDYGVAPGVTATEADLAAAFRCGVPNVNSLLCVVAGDSFRPTDAMLAAMPEGLHVASLRSLSGAEASRAAEIAEQCACRSAAEAVNALFLADGIYIRVDEGVAVERAIQIVNIFNSAKSMLVPRRVIVDVQPGARVKILLCSHTQSTDAVYLSSEVVQIGCGEGAAVELYDIEENNATARRSLTVDARLASRASMVLNATYLRGGESLSSYNIDLVGEGAEANLGGLAITADKQIAGRNVVLRHLAGRCTSRQLFKNALFDSSRGAFGGRIVVSEGAVHTDARQTNRNILIGDEARMATAPQLEIYCDDVKCSHGATTGQLDERALFYMQTRGIPRDEARRMLTEAFMADVVDNISYEVLRQRLHILVEKRLSGAEADCSSCATACHSNPQSPDDK